MKRQRNKSELLNALRVHELLKEDKEKGYNLQEKTVFWRMGVIWTTVLWKEENFSTPKLARFLQHMADSDLHDLTEERRAKINTMLDERTELRLKNQTVRKNYKNKIDDEVNRLENYNSEVCVNYSLLAVEYLIQKGYGKKRLYRVLGDVYNLDLQPAQILWNARQDIYESKGIWISLEDGDRPAGTTTVIERSTHGN